MTDKPTTAETSNVDDLSRLQKCLEELSDQFFSAIGVLQRDAPPLSRGNGQKDMAAKDEETRQQLAEKAPTFAKRIVSVSRQIDGLINTIETKMEALQGKERTLLDTANFESVQAGDEMTEAVDDAQKLLAGIRNIITARETES